LAISKIFPTFAPSKNPILAHPVYLAGYIERLGTGTNDMIDACIKKGLQKPEFIQEEDFWSIMVLCIAKDRTKLDIGHQMNNERDSSLNNTTVNKNN